jgi:hypothetical protein
MYVGNFFLICIVGGGIQTWSTRHVGHFNLGLLYLPRVIVRLENLVEWMAGETEVLGENLPRRHFVHHKSTWPDPGLNPSRRGGKPATNRLSYGAAMYVGKSISKLQMYIELKQIRVLIWKKKTCISPHNLPVHWGTCPILSQALEKQQHNILWAAVGTRR